jgi:ATP-binding cassette subfamily B protein
MFGGHVVMKAYNGEQKSIEKINHFNSTLFFFRLEITISLRMMMPIMNFIGNLGYVGIAI